MTKSNACSGAAGRAARGGNPLAADSIVGQLGNMFFRPAILVALMVTAGVAADSEYPQVGPDIYDPQVDGGTLVESALQRARAGGRMVLLDFGANWCPWCHKLHSLFIADAGVRTALERDYVLVMIDVNKRKGPARNAAVDERYGNPTRYGLPVLVVLDGAGKQLATQDTGELETGDHHDPAKVLAFLARSVPLRPSH